MSRMSADHERIWLAPRCEGERTWAPNDAWGKCEDCGAPSVEYVRADLSAPPGAMPVAWLRTETPDPYGGMRRELTLDAELAEMWRLSPYTKEMTPLFAHPAPATESEELERTSLYGDYTPITVRSDTRAEPIMPWIRAEAAEASLASAKAEMERRGEALREISSQAHNLPRSATADRIDTLARALLESAPSAPSSPQGGKHG